MYLLSQEVTLEWSIPATASPPALADLDLVVIDPSGIKETLESPLSAENYTPPTENSAGSVTYLFTPHQEGFWRIRLVTGTAGSYQILSKMEMFVFDSTNTTTPFSDDIGRPAPYDINYYLQGKVVAGEVYGSFIATRSISLAENMPGSQAICEVYGPDYPTEFTILHNGVSIGTVRFEPDSYVGTIVSEPTLLTIGDTLQLKVTGLTDVEISDITVNLVGCCTVVPCTVF